MECWQTIPTVSDLEASDLGRIRRSSGKIYSQKISHKGYARVFLRRDGVHRSFHVNRLVCAAFHGKAPTPQHEAAHLDGVRANNAPSNLEWKTPTENADDKLRHDTHLMGERNPSARLTEQEVIAIHLASKAGAAASELASAHRVSEKTIRNIRDGHKWGWLTTRGSGSS